MTKQYTYIEYEKLSDAVRDWENGEPIYRKRSGEWVYLDHDNFCQYVKYAKRVDIEERTINTWVIFDCEGVPKCIGSENIVNLPAGWQNIKLTGSIKE